MDHTASGEASSRYTLDCNVLKDERTDKRTMVNIQNIHVHGKNLTLIKYVQVN